MSDVDWIATLTKFAIPAIWLAIKLMSKSRTPSVPVPEVPPTSLPPPRESMPTQAGGRQALAERHAALVSRKDAAKEVVRARGARGEALMVVLEGAIEPRLERVAHAFAVGAAEANGRALHRLLVEAEQQLAVVAVSNRIGEDRSLDEVMADAEAIADACLAPLRSFAEVYEIDFPQQVPICQPAGIVGGEAVVMGLLGAGHPLIFVPHDFAHDLYRWPSLAHEVGHVVLRGVPGLLDEMGSAAGWDARPELLAVVGGRLSGTSSQIWSAWREEIFADALTVLMLGPSALHGFTASFARPDRPLEVLTALAEDGRYAPHPPAHLRLHLAAFLLEEVGFIEAGRHAAREWNRIHRFPEVLDAEDAAAPTLVLPLAGGKTIGFALDHALEQGTAGIRAWVQAQYRSLAGHTILEVPGFDVSPGVWARVRTLGRQLREGRVVGSDARLLLAAALWAGQEPGADLMTLAATVRLSIVGRGERKWRGASKIAAARSPDDRRSVLLDALLLQDVVGPPAAYRPPGTPRRSSVARTAGRP